MHPRILALTIVVTCTQCGDDAVVATPATDTRDEADADAADEASANDEDDGKSDDADSNDSGDGASDDTQDDGQDDGDEDASTDTDDDADSDSDSDSDDAESTESSDEDEGQNDEDTGSDGCPDGIQIDIDDLRTWLEIATGEREVEIDGEARRIPERSTDEHRRWSRSWLRREFEAMGYEVEELEFDEGINLEARHARGDDRFVILSAHYDSMSSSPGADDNASGIAVGLAIAKAVRDCEFDHGLRIVNFDQSVLGGAGSRAFAETLDLQGDADNLLGVVHVDGAGYDSDGDRVWQLTDCGFESSDELVQIAMDAATNVGDGMQMELQCGARSDQQSFWEAGLPAVLMTQRQFGESADINPCVRMDCDTIESIDLEYLRGIATAAGRTVSQLLSLD